MLFRKGKLISAVPPNLFKNRFNKDIINSVLRSNVKVDEKALIDRLVTLSKDHEKKKLEMKNSSGSSMLFRIEEEQDKSISGTNDSKNSSDHRDY